MLVFWLQVPVVEVAAFSSVHDMIHAAIISHGTTASLREVRSDPPAALLSGVQVCRRRSVCLRVETHGALAVGHILCAAAAPGCW